MFSYYSIAPMGCQIASFNFIHFESLQRRKVRLDYPHKAIIPPLLMNVYSKEEGLFDDTE